VREEQAFSLPSILDNVEGLSPYIIEQHKAKGFSDLLGVGQAYRLTWWIFFKPERCYNRRFDWDAFD